MKKQIGFDKSDLFLLCYVALLCSCWCIALLEYPEGVTLDDGWIHLSFARNLCRNHVWSINPQEGVSGGASSILWVLLLAGGYLFTDNGVWMSYFYNFVFLGCLSLLQRRFIEEIFQSWRHWKIILASLFIISVGNLIWFAFSGMETLAFVVPGLSSIYFASRKEYVLAGIFSFFIALVRPEGIIVAVIVAVLVRRKPKASFWIFLSGFSGFVLTCFWNYYLTGTILPSTLIGRRWIIGASMSAEMNPVRVIVNFFRIVGIWGYRLMEFGFGEALLVKIGFPNWLAWAIAGCGGLLCVVGFFRYLDKMRFCTKGLFAWVLLMIFAYSVMMPTRGHAGRYQPMTIVFAMICFLLGIDFFWRLKIKFMTPVKFGVVGLIVMSLCSVYIWCRITQMSLLHIDRVHISAARWIDKNTPDDSKIAAFDIGALAYFGNRRIIDLGGLIDPEAGIAMYERSVVRYIHDKKADYLMMIFPYTQPDIYINALGLDEMIANNQLELLSQFHIDIVQPYWPGEAERLLTNTIKVYRVKYLN